jgi:diaminohydroxyphosphoribosylaminopyrimidine deaminase/5-amino-6-(5-phosphoribosylamino)uracil reductase
MYRHQIQSVIEGGRQTLQTFIDANLWDEARVFSGNTIFLKKA